MVERLIAHLAHAEVITPKPQQSAAFFRRFGLKNRDAAVDQSFFAVGANFFITRCN